MSQKTEFKVIPKQDELDTIERDLRFHPCLNDRPQTITCEQIGQFNRDGYIKGLRIFSTEEIADYRRYFDELLAKVLAAGGDTGSSVAKTLP